MTAICNSTTELVSRTPIVKLNKIVPEGSADVFVKLEFFNPGGNVKDRIALSMIEKAKHGGLSKPSDTIIEPTSRNTGTGLSVVGAARRYKAIIVIPETTSIEKYLLMKGYDVELVLTPGVNDTSGSIREAECLVKENDYFLPLQFENEASPPVHGKTTGPEIHQAFGVSGSDVFAAGIGTGGTIIGADQELKRVYPKIELIGVESAESAILGGKEAGPRKIQGIGTGPAPKTLDTSVYDKILSISGDEAMGTVKEIGRKEGILVGISSSVAVAAMLRVAKESGKGKKVLAMVFDSGERYLSTTLYQKI